jgi:hypothetical protein
MYTKYTDHIHLPSSSPFTLSHTGPVLPSCPSFFKYILIVQGDFILVFHTCVYHTVVRLTPSINSLYHSFPYSSTAFSIFCYTIFIQRYNVLILSLYHSLFPSGLFLVPSDRHTITIMFFLSLSLPTHIYV